MTPAVYKYFLYGHIFFAQFYRLQVALPPPPPLLRLTGSSTLHNKALKQQRPMATAAVVC
jgi:hypothetical protein